MEVDFIEGDPTQTREPGNLLYVHFGDRYFERLPQPMMSHHPPLTLTLLDRHRRCECLSGMVNASTLDLTKHYQAV